MCYTLLKTRQMPDFGQMSAICKVSQETMPKPKTKPLPPECLRQPYETAAAYRAFIEFYLPLAQPRSRVEAYWHYKQSKSNNPAMVVRPKQPSGTWTRWAMGRLEQGDQVEGALTWEQRATAYDKVIHEQLETTRQLQRLSEVEREIEATDNLLTLFNKLMESAPAFLTSKRIEEADGKIQKIYETVALNVNGLRQLAALHADIISQRRLALGMPQKVSELQHGNANKEPFKIKDVTVDDLIKDALKELEEFENGES